MEEDLTPNPNEEVVIPPVEEEQPEEPVVEAPEAEEEIPEAEEPEAPAPEEPELTPRQQKRANQLEKLLDKINQQDELRAKSTPAKREAGPIIPEGDYTLAEINALAEKHAAEREAAAQTNRSAILFETRLTVEKPQAYAAHEFLNPQSESFDPGRTSFINRMYLNAVGYDSQTGSVQNHSITYPEFVDGFMEAVGEVAQAEVVESTQRIAKQVAQTGPRPGGSAKSAPNFSTDPSQMTDEELDAAILATMPKGRIR